MQSRLDDRVMRRGIDRLLAPLPHVERWWHLDDPARSLGMSAAGDFPSPIVRAGFLMCQVRAERSHVALSLHIENRHVDVGSNVSAWRNRFIGIASEGISGQTRRVAPSTVDEVTVKSMRHRV